MFIPHLHIQPSMFFISFGPFNLEAVAHCRIAVVQRMCSQDNMFALLTMKKGGMKIVYDLDDDLWSVPTYNPAYRYFHSIRKGFCYCASVADVVTVSTEPLRQAARSAISKERDVRCPPIEVIPNALDFNMYRPVPLHLRRNKGNRVTLGWAGTNSHIGDVGQIFNLLPELLEKYENLDLEFIGLPPPESLRGSPRVRERDFVPISEYPARLSSWQWDIALAPLDDNRFNRSKSSLKMAEFGALHIPCVSSSVAPYIDFCRNSPLLKKTVLCRTRKDWLEKVSALIESAELRREVGVEMYRVSYETNIEKTAEKWLQVFTSTIQD